MVLVENYAGHSQNWQQCFNDPKRSDVVLEAKDGQTFHCEKFVLGVASPYFERLFSHGKDSTNFVSAKDVEPAALKWILRACYTADGDLNDDNVIGVMVAAKMYEMNWVSKACMKYLKQDKGKPVATFQYSHDMEKWQEWKVPQSSWYHIVAMGAKAADQPKANAQNYKAKGGIGAIVGGSFEFGAGDVVQILTGGMSRVYTEDKHCTGGAGGTFVALKKKELSLLLAAGGGGGPNGLFYGADANLDEDGSSANSKFVGGKNGGNGGNNGEHKGGLGWKAGPAALAKPTTAGVNDTGGFGGGGGVVGGGGGYSGGGAGHNSPGGGGGSYIASEAENSWKRLGNFGHGKVLIFGGKDLPPSESPLVDQYGNPNDEILSQLDEESMQSWEVVE
ncbi:hypothetical protein BSKO_02937 [Bryopsis sp. KO-2023]|nr:hypothetical protein BSKO_02937 [Bryopsis sp. KO-2023]